MYEQSEKEFARQQLRELDVTLFAIAASVSKKGADAMSRFQKSLIAQAQADHPSATGKSEPDPGELKANRLRAFRALKGA